MGNILWQNLSPKEIQKMIREWPADGYPVTANKPAVKVPTVKIDAKKHKVKVVAAGAANRGRKHFGADGEVKFVEHRNIWIGFFGGRAVAKSKTEDGCRAILKRIHNV